ncbi:16S rRNA (guanine(527)-N(7))-methyltransferase RsmG [Cereibacter johrii]|uniref:Ribosomal RNA small subunit methyltransferase G n=1 Tax=Cereibacter johrii TaxID=445629 RepID=A0ABX5J500_9RHOB|nr:16S rRNA (guanine(527)-N(7))-methyltransferase RsmG [Cereibacter johrii]ODM42234.1 16S rRNA (guanine(527)-N(7))-methyltransferase RsmG [Cereibacter johrii]PTM77672.1 16S rRNA m(7)G-527 methyltransferase [Cereibacter johrii]
MMQESVLAQLDVSRETSEKLSHFVALVEKWNKAVNLIGRSTVDSIWTRHVLDSAQLRAHLALRPRLWLDLGSGSGFPGIVIAIIAADESPESRFVLVESDQRKATFLRTACRELELSASVLAARIESLPPQGADVISARALAALPELCALAAPHLAPNGICLFPKGAGHISEIAAARQSWNMELETLPSLTDPDAVILKLKALAHV